MTWSFLLPMLLVVANVMGAGMILPQVLRFRRHRLTEGVSGAWVGVGIAMNAWWCTYALQGQLWGLVPVSVGAFVLYCVMGVQYTGLVGRAALPRIGTGAAVTASIPFLFLVGWGWSAAGLAIGVAYGVQFAPAAVTAVRSVDLGGISPVTWTMAWIEASIWLLYGLVEHDGALTVGGGGGAVLATIILVSLYVNTRRGSAPPAGPQGAMRYGSQAGGASAR